MRFKRVVLALACCAPFGVLRAQTPPAAPKGTVAFLNTTSCPTGWAAATDAAGRLIVGATNGADVGLTVGTPLTDQQNPTHSHKYSTTVKLSDKSISGATGGGNGQGAKKGTYTVSGTSAAATTDLPFVQLTVCEMGGTASSTDGMPINSVSYFSGTSCPAGWEAFDLAYGYTIVPVNTTAGIGGQVGESLTSQENPKHHHSFDSSIDVSSCEYMLIPGCCNHHLAKHGTKSFSGDTDDDSTALPYIQYLVCQKTASPPSNADAVPKGTLTFTGSMTCPSGWSEALTIEGRMLVGLPASGQPGRTFGGSSLAPLENRKHAHTVSGSVSTTKQKIAGASGCCAHGYGKNGTYKYSSTSGDQVSEMPYLQLLMCEKD